MSTDKTKTSFILYTDTYEATKDLTLEDKGRLFDAIFLYNLGEDLPEMTGTVKVAFGFLRVAIARDASKWEKIRNARKEAGRLGGLKRAENESLLRINSSKPKQEQANQAVNVPVPVINIKTTGNDKTLLPLQETENTNTGGLTPEQVEKAWDAAEKLSAYKVEQERRQHAK